MDMSVSTDEVSSRQQKLRKITGMFIDDFQKTSTTRYDAVRIDQQDLKQTQYGVTKCTEH